MVGGEYVVGFLILLLFVLSILVAAVISVFEIPKYLRHTRK